MGIRWVTPLPGTVLSQRSSPIIAAWGGRALYSLWEGVLNLVQSIVDYIPKIGILSLQR